MPLGEETVASMSSNESAVIPMLTSARQRAQRARFGRLLSAIRAEQHSQGIGGIHASAFGSARTEAAGAFGCLDPDMACLLLCRLLQVDVCQGSSRSDRVPPAPHEAILAAGRDAQHLAQTCHFLNACMRLHGHGLRLEMAAARCTPFAPALASSALPSLQGTPFATPWFSQCMREERSRFDVQMLESALVSMVPHCAGEHCRSVRRAHNLRLSSAEYRAEHQQSQMRSVVLGALRPCLKVVYDEPAAVFAHAARSDYLLATEENGEPRIAVMSDDPPDVLDPHTELRCRWRTNMPSIPGRTRVTHLAISACGMWVATLQLHMPTVSANTFPDSHVTLWEVGSSGGPRVSRCFRDTLVQTLWFRTANLDASDAADGVARSNATVLCFYASVCHPSTTRSSVWARIASLTAGEAHVANTAVYQFCVEDDSFANANVSDRGQPEWWLGHRLCLSGTAAELSNIVPGRKPNDIQAHSAEDETALISLSASNCADSTAACFFGVAHFQGFRPFPVAQAVVLDLSYRHRNNADVDMTRSLTPMICVSNAQSEKVPRRIYLGPCGDLVVVLCGRLVQGVAVDYELQVFRRRGNQAHFTVLAHVPLNRCIHHFRTERSLVSAVCGSAPRPAWRINVTQPPTSCAFSPCGRFLLLGFANGLHSVAQQTNPGVNLHFAAPAHADGGVCVIDLSEIWERPPARDLESRSTAIAAATKRPTRTVAWIECMNNLVPLQMHWTVAGIWINTHRGALLLGTTTPTSSTTPVAGSSGAEAVTPLE